MALTDEDTEPSRSNNRRRSGKDHYTKEKRLPSLEAAVLLVGPPGLEPGTKGL